MKTKLLFLCLLLASALIAGGCAGLAGVSVDNRTATNNETPQEEHFLTFRHLTDEEKAVRYLTGEEKEAAIGIAKAALKAAGGSQPNDYNRATFVWIAQTSDGTRTKLDYDIVEKGLPANAPLNADYYPGLEYQMGSSNSKIVVVDLQKSTWDWTEGEPPEDHPDYYLRCYKTFHRMGGELHYACADNRDFLLALCRELEAT